MKYVEVWLWRTLGIIGQLAIFKSVPSWIYNFAHRVMSYRILVNPFFSTWRLHVVWMYMYIWWVCTRAASKENPNPNPNPHDHTITAYLVSGNVVRVRILICATRQKPCRKSVPGFLRDVFQRRATEETRHQQLGCCQLCCLYTVKDRLTLELVTRTTVVFWHRSGPSSSSQSTTGWVY